MISEKRIMTLSNNGGYQIYHFQPATEFNNQATLVPFTFGMETTNRGGGVGPSKNSYTRYSAALLSGNDGSVGVPNGHGYDTYLTFQPGV